MRNICGIREALNSLDMPNSKYNSIFVVGPTAGGKTRIAVQLAHRLNGEVISADSRQVYKKLNIGTGKDLNEYFIDGKQINYHLIDICEPGEKYNIEIFFNDAEKAIKAIYQKKKLPIICGGSGLYVETLLKGNSFSSIPKNERLREKLMDANKTNLDIVFEKIPLALRNKLDNSSIKKCIRSIEINAFVQEKGMPKSRCLNLKPLFVAPKWDREERRNRVSIRLKQRLNEGLVEEVEQLLKTGIQINDLEFYGLEYFWLTQYCTGKIKYDEMTEKLETAIHQFAKRQMTWFRRMERQGHEIHWLNPNTAVEDTIDLWHSGK